MAETRRYTAAELTDLAEALRLEVGDFGEKPHLLLKESSAALTQAAADLERLAKLLTWVREQCEKPIPTDRAIGYDAVLAEAARLGLPAAHGGRDGD